MAAQIQRQIQKAFGGMLAVYKGLEGEGYFGHRGPFHAKVSIELDGKRLVEYEESLGSPGPDRPPFDAIARSKHAISRRAGEDTVDVPLADRMIGDTQYWGSVVREFEGGRIIVAISGLQPWFDEALSGVLASILLGLLKHEELVPQGFEPDRSRPDFLTEEWLSELPESHAAESAWP
ncbi:MAG: hypothetical protein WD603_02665 [Patescibacteria group bacterium]